MDVRRMLEAGQHRGPETGNPYDAEPGHAEDCARLAEAVAAWDAQWEAGE